MKKTQVSLKFPAQFSKYIDHTNQLEFEGESVADFFAHLETTFGNVKERILEGDGQVRPYINIFIGKKNIKSLSGVDSIIPEGSCVSLLLSRAGG
ncbi:MAG: hypothetical protein AAF985_19080 [Bacteroidota bacterium]